MSFIVSFLAVTVSPCVHTESHFYDVIWCHTYTYITGLVMLPHLPGNGTVACAELTIPKCAILNGTEPHCLVEMGLCYTLSTCKYVQDQISNLIRKFWMYTLVSSQLGMPRIPSNGGHNQLDVLLSLVSVISHLFFFITQSWDHRWWIESKSIGRIQSFEFRFSCLFCKGVWLITHNMFLRLKFSNVLHPGQQLLSLTEHHPWYGRFTVILSVHCVFSRSDLV